MARRAARLTHEQLDILTREGCDEVQGYLIGHPRPIAVYADIICGEREGAELSQQLG